MTFPIESLQEKRLAVITSQLQFRNTPKSHGQLRPCLMTFQRALETTLQSCFGDMQHPDIVN